jgi:hypothetical protein
MSLSARDQGRSDNREDRGLMDDGGDHWGAGIPAGSWGGRMAIYTHVSPYRGYGRIDPAKRTSAFATPHAPRLGSSAASATCLKNGRF